MDRKVQSLNNRKLPFDGAPTPARFTPQRSFVRLFNQKVFDEYLVGNTPEETVGYSAAQWEEPLGAAEFLVLHAIVDQVKSGTCTLTVDLQGCNDDKLWQSLPGSGAPVINSVALSTTAVTSFLGGTFGNPLKYARLKVSLGGAGSILGARVCIYASDQGTPTLLLASLTSITDWYTHNWRNVAKLGAKKYSPPNIETQLSNEYFTDSGPPHFFGQI